MSTPAPILFTILIVCCSTGTGLCSLLSPVKDMEHQQLTLVSKTTMMHDLVNSPTTQVTVPAANIQSPGIVTVPSGPPLSVTPPTNPVTKNPSGPPPTPVVAPPASGGQVWCVAKSGAQTENLQKALDYACGIADCSALQQGGTCYSPVTLQNHASYAFNSYCHKNPAQKMSCEFGGAATLTNVNPSSGSCTYPTLSSSTSPTPMTPTPTIGSSSGLATPPSILSGNIPDSPPSSSACSISMSMFLRQLFIVMTSFITVKLMAFDI